MPKMSVTSVQDNQRSEWSNYGSPFINQAPLTPEREPISPRQANIVLAVLCLVKMTSTMDMFIMSGVLPSIQTFFDASDMSAGFLQTVVFVSVPLWTPLFGYLGDRFNRKYILMGGICIYTVTAFCCSFVTKSLYWLLIVLRFSAGIGESAISTISAQMLIDLFSGDQLTIVFYVFASLIGSGCGLGLIVGAGMTTLTGDWRWALWIVPILDVVAIILVGLLLPNQVRSASDTNGQEVKKNMGEDIKYLLKNKSYILTTFAFIAVNFSNSAMTLWMSTFMSRARVAQGIQQPCNNEPCDSTDSYIFGAVTILTAFLGAALGAGSSRQWRDKVPNVDTLICTVAILGFILCSFILTFMASESIPVTYVFIGLRGIFIVALHSVAADITLYIVVPTRRAAAVAVMFTATVLGGATGGSSVIGMVSDAIRNSHPPSDDWSFLGLKYSLLICPCVAVLSGILFITTSFYIAKDKRAVQQWIDDNSTQQNPSSEVPGN